MVYFFIGLVIGLAVGFLLRMFTAKALYDGNFKIDTSDPLKDRYMLELTTALEGIDKKKAITLKVVSSHEKHTI